MEEGRLVRAARANGRTQPLRVAIEFVRGEAVAIDGERIAGGEILQAPQSRVRAVRRRPRSLHRRHHDRPEGPHRVRSAGPDRVARRASRARGSGADQAAEPLQARGRPQVGGAGVRRASIHDPLKSDLEAFLASTQRMVNGEVVLETRGGSVDAVAVKSPHILQTAEGDLCAVGRLGRRGGRGLHPPVRHELDAVGRGQPSEGEGDDVSDVARRDAARTFERWSRSTPAIRRARSAPAASSTICARTCRVSPARRPITAPAR